MNMGINMTNVDTLVTVNLEKYSNGYIATSPWSKGFFVAHKSFDKLVRDIPVAIRLLMKAKHGRNFIVEEMRDNSDDKTAPVDRLVFAARQAAA